MAGLQRRLDNAIANNERLKQELEDLRAVTGWIDPEYAAALRNHADLALGRIRREGAGVTTPPSSQPPSYEPRAYDDLRQQRVIQRREAAKLRRRIRHLVDRDRDPEDASEGRHPVPPTPNPQTRMAKRDSTNSIPIRYDVNRRLRSAPWNGQPLPQPTTPNTEAGLAAAPTAQTLRAGFTEGQAT